ncbi:MULTISPECIES: hypothetical protein [Crateriforma]|uniref:Uncharacterized protein n=1 Tax=Crateriforma conspicua TaxID=2527996 RepID=A0A5C5Y847_9PLAN|nr:MULTISPECIES: hypothetical protein [Crateriforma]QDV65738.1 hypothetical protein Mal65_49110 [Crateriforma conspicua]TWT71138.1 hypothetical protein Pan14r_34480 [Crateriforma conspicua]
MSRDNYRTVGALLGLALGIGLMFLLGQDGLVAGAIFGAGGCVLGGITGEIFFDRRKT